jgi:predicted TIM-barrel fold metal-dependent hydrolase
MRDNSVSKETTEADLKRLTPQSVAAPDQQAASWQAPPDRIAGFADIIHRLKD